MAQRYSFGEKHKNNCDFCVLFLFLPKDQKDWIMLGIDNKRPPIQEPFASQIRDAVRRISTGQLNEHDEQVIKESEEIRRAYHATWE